MNEAIDFLTSNTTLAYLTALAIFIITLILLARRIIGVIVTVILLIFALLSGLAIANHDLFREILTSFKYEPEKIQGGDTLNHYKNQIIKAYEEIKEELEKHSNKIEALYENYSKPAEKELPKLPNEKTTP